MPQLTITAPEHPLFGLTLPVVHLPMAPPPPTWVMVELPNGTCRRVPYAITAPAPPLATLPILPVSAHTLLPPAHHVRCLLHTTEESPNERPPETTDRWPAISSDVPDGSPSSLAEPGSGPTPPTGPVVSGVEPTPTQSLLQPPRGEQP